MNPMRMLILLTVVGTTGSILFAAEPTGSRQSQPAAAPAPAAGAQAEQQSESAAATDEKVADAAAAEEDDEAPPPKTGADNKGPSPQRFIPSEQVRADFDVSFPVDI